jgi:hypothetical protein
MAIVVDQYSDRIAGDAPLLADTLGAFVAAVLPNGPHGRRPSSGAGRRPSILATTQQKARSLSKKSASRASKASEGGLESHYLKRRKFR